MLLMLALVAPPAARTAPSSEQRKAQTCHDRGLAAFREKKWEAALVLFKASLALDPDLLAARFWLGRIQFEQQDWSAAEESFRQVLAKKPSSLESHYWLARVLEATQRLEEARQEYQAVLQLGLPDEDANDAAARLKFLGPGAGPMAPVPAEKPAVEPPAAEEPTAEKAGVKAPAAETTAEAPPTQPPTVVIGPVEEQPTPAEPTAEERAPMPGEETPAVEEPVAGEPTGEEPAAEPEEEKPAAEEPAAEEGPAGGGERALALLNKLKGGEPVTLVVLGDQFAAAPGVGDPGRDSFAALFVELLQRRFEGARIQLVPVTVRGLTEEALDLLDDEVLARQPDLVVVQLGGTDAAQSMPVEDFQDSLNTVVETLVDGTKAAVVLATPLVDTPRFDTEFVTAVKELAQGQPDRAVADFDTAVKRQGRDHRGLFPYGQPPHEYAHTAAARELYQAFQRLIGEEPTLQLDLATPLQFAALGQEVTVALKLKNEGQEPQTGQVRMGMGHQTKAGPFTVAAGQGGQVPLTVTLPAQLPNQRSQCFQVWGLAQSEGQAAADARWLAVSPVIPCPTLEETPTLEDEALWAADLERYPLGRPNLVVGANAWGGEEDASGEFSVARDEDTFYLFVNVTDNHLSPTGSNIWAFNDCLELYFDLRPPAQRGQPVCSQQNLLLFVILPPAEGVPAILQPLDVQPPGLNQAQVRYTRTAEGYQVQVGIPFQVLQRVAGQPLESFGFDLVMDDSDVAGQRKTQLAWAGYANNFLNPRAFGEVMLKPEVAKGTVKVTVW